MPVEPGESRRDLDGTIVRSDPGDISFLGVISWLVSRNPYEFDLVDLLGIAGVGRQSVNEDLYSKHSPRILANFCGPKLKFGLAHPSEMPGRRLQCLRAI